MKPRIGIFGLSGCWGEQIVILNCEEELLPLLGKVDIVDFAGASTANDDTGPLDIALVEGAVGSAREESALRRIRARTRVLVACGSCACFGGVTAALTSNRHEAAARVYGPAHLSYDVLAPRALSEVVTVDASIPGCPMEGAEFLAAVACLLNGDRPQPISYPVCAECRMREHECLLITYGIDCSGPITAGGCGARCPGYDAPCIGCRGPADEANVSSMEAIVVKAGFGLEEFRHRQRLFAGGHGR